VARKLVKEGICAAGVWYLVEPFMDIGPDSMCEHCCGWGHIESKCSSKPVCGCCSGPHRTRDHTCNVVGCTAKQGSLCGHTQEKCPNCKGRHIAFSSRCAKKVEDTREAWGRRRKEPAGQTMQTMGPTTGANRIVLGLRTRVPEGGKRSGSDEEMADAQEGGREADDVTMADSTSPTAIAMVGSTAAGTATAAVTSIEVGNETGAAATNV